MFLLLITKKTPQLFLINCIVPHSLWAAMQLTQHNSARQRLMECTAAAIQDRARERRGCALCLIDVCA